MSFDKSRIKSIIALHGPQGVGKTWVTQQLAGMYSTHDVNFARSSERVWLRLAKLMRVEHMSNAEFKNTVFHPRLTNKAPKTGRRIIIDELRKQREIIPHIVPKNMMDDVQAMEPTPRYPVMDNAGNPDEFNWLAGYCISRRIPLHLVTIGVHGKYNHNDFFEDKERRAILSTVQLTQEIDGTVLGYTHCDSSGQALEVIRNIIEGRVMPDAEDALPGVLPSND